MFLGITTNVNNFKIDPVVVDMAPYQQPTVPVYYSLMSNSSLDPLAAMAGVENTDIIRTNLDNITDISAFLYQKAFSERDSRYGAYFYQASTSNGLLTDTVNVFINTTAQYALPAYFNFYNEGLLKQITGVSSAQISLTVSGFPQTSALATLISGISAIIIGIAFAFIPANFLSYIVKEKAVKVKHLQFISGVSPVSYWAANFAFDMVQYIIPAALCLLAVAIFGIDELIGSNVGATIIVLIMYGISVIPFCAACSFLFDSPTSAQNIMLIFFILVGAFLVIISLVLSLLSSTKSISNAIRWVFRLLPTFCFAESISSLITRSSPQIHGAALGQFDMDIIGWNCVFMAWEAVFYTLVVLAIEYIQASPVLFTWFSKRVTLPKSELSEEDADVKAERARLQAIQSQVSVDPTVAQSLDPVSIFGLRKVYPSRLGSGPKIAVHDLWLSIASGECLGFLGINGAGKTTSMKMMTNDIYPTEGDAWLGGMSVLTQQQEIRRLIGYCPQFDALLGTLTAREMLTLFARIKGVKEESLHVYVSNVIHELGFQSGIADRPCKGYSGGNKRKLCVGLALIGNPHIVFLDEPSTGMDPQSRRNMWDLIARTMKGRAVILTTHSMEECEALCQRIAIMVGGSMRCLGTAHHLKSLYGNGFQLDVTLAPGHGQSSAFTQWVGQQWSEARVIEGQDNYIKYQIPKQKGARAISIGSLFRSLEAVKEQYGVREYAVSETTLEQIFLYFAKQQAEEKGEIAGLQGITTQQ